MWGTRGIIVFAIGAVLVGCAPSSEEATYRARRERLLRQNQGIRELIEEQERGSLVPTGRFLVGLDETIVRDLLRSQLPFERVLDKNFMVRLDSAEVLLRDKYGAIILSGVLYRAATPQRTTRVRVHGALGDVTIDPVTDRMRIGIAIEHVELLEAGLLEGVLGRAGKRLVANKGRELLQEKIPDIEVPVALAQRIAIPAIQGGGLVLDSLSVPLNVSVERVLAASGKLWVTVNAEVGPVTGADSGLAVAIKKKKKRPASKSTRPDTSGGGR